MHLKIVNYKFCTGRGQNKFQKVCSIHLIIYILIRYVQTNVLPSNLVNIHLHMKHQALIIIAASILFFDDVIMMSSFDILSGTIACISRIYFFHHSSNLVKLTIVTFQLMSDQLRENAKYRSLIKFLERVGFNLVRMNVSFIHLYEYC